MKELGRAWKYKDLSNYEFTELNIQNDFSKFPNLEANEYLVGLADVVKALLSLRTLMGRKTTFLLEIKPNLLNYQN